jgi:hypothetical protein
MDSMQLSEQLDTPAAPPLDDLAMGPSERAYLVVRIAELRQQLEDARRESELMRDQRDQFYALVMVSGVVV